MIVCAAFVLSACSLPEPDGTELVLIEKAESLPALSADGGSASGRAVKRGLLISPSVREAASNVSASADEVRVQRAAIFPSIGISLSGGVGDATEDETNIDLRGRQLIADFGATKRAVSAADIDLQISYLTFQEAIDDAAFDVLEATADVQRYAGLLQVRQRQVAALRNLQGKVAERVEIGAAPSSDRLETRKQVQTAEFELQDASLGLAEARDRLVRLTGNQTNGGVPAIPVGACGAGVSSDALRIARLEYARAEIELVQAERRRDPRAYIEPLARHRVGEGGVSLGVNIGVDSDLLQGGALSAAANAARNARDAARANVEAVARDKALDENALKRDIASGVKRTQLLQRQINLLSQTKQLYRSQYFDLGTRDVFDLLENEQEFFDRQAQLVDQKFDLTQSRLRCAIRARALRPHLKIDQSTLYGYPLAHDAI